MLARVSGKLDPVAVARTIAELAATLGNRLVTSSGVREQHSNRKSWIAGEPPDAVIFPQSTEDVQRIVQICSGYRVPIIPYGAGTSFEGHVNAPFGGVSIDLRDMNGILAVHSDDLDCVIEPGVTRTQLNDHLRDRGLFFPVDPAATATLGGMAATRASGTNTVRYGTMKENVIALKAVLANGEVIQTSRRAKKSAAGYDLTRLLIGSEGTLGIITELTLRLSVIPEAIAAGICPFPSIEAACNAAILTIQSAIPIARIELLDALQVKACNLYSKLALPETPILFVEFHGTDACVAEQSARFGEIASDLGGGPFEWATNLEDRTRLSMARQDAYWAACALRAGTHAIASDVCVPISRLAECIAATQQDIETSGLLAPIVGHVGDGNFHLMLIVDMRDADEVTRATKLLERLIERALAMDGTCTGEHGVGEGKMKYLLSEHGPGALDAMRAIKLALDPLNIMNPGKIFQMSEA